MNDVYFLVITAAVLPTVIFGGLLMFERGRARALDRTDAEVRRIRSIAEREAEALVQAAQEQLARAERETIARDRALRERIASAEEQYRARLEGAKRERDALLGTAPAELADLTARITAARRALQSLESDRVLAASRLATLNDELAAVELSADLVEVGLFRPVFTYENAEAYQAALSAIRDRQRALVSEGLATVSPPKTGRGRTGAGGTRTVRQVQKMLLRAFNSEASAAIAKVTWSNYATMSARIIKAFETSNRHGESFGVGLTAAYLDLWLTELKLVFEAAEKRRHEQEQRRLHKSAQREEARVQRELAKAEAEAAREEERVARELEEAQESLRTARAEEDRSAMANRIADLEARLAAAHERKERAIAQAQLTKVGHVYIISNTGAFGEGVVKIGMTRRLEPEERIQELGDASVPFPFDVHALIYSENAPELEAHLHNRLWDRRVNWANDRKEFFRVSIREVQETLSALGHSIDVRLQAEAREYRETLAVTRDAHRRDATPSQVAHTSIH